MGNSSPGSVHDAEVEVPYDVKTDGWRLWMFGDSILDNSYWNGVEANTTGEWLKKMLPKVEIKDRSTEELCAMSLLGSLRSGRNIQVRSHYVNHRSDIGIPYDPPNGAVNPNPQDLATKKDFVLICASGNDFALRGEMNPSVIIGYVREIIQFYKQRGVKPQRIIYMATYGPNIQMKTLVWIGHCQNLMALYNQLCEEAEETCREEGVNCMLLNDFYGVAGAGIPEPTPSGARELAERIQRVVLQLIAKEEA